MLITYSGSNGCFGDDIAPIIRSLPSYQAPTLTHVQCMLAFYRKKVSSEAEAVSEELEVVSDPGAITKGTDVLLGFC